MGPMPNHASTRSTCLWHVERATWGMSQMFRLLFLGNGWADCVEIWHAVGDPLVTAYAVITGGVSLHVRTCRDTPTPRFCISETARPIVFKFGMWFLGSLAKCLPQVIGGVHLHVRTCAPLSHKCSACRHSETVGPIALKFGMLLETH